MKDQSAFQLAALKPDLTVADLLKRWGQTASVFVNLRMACVGCPLSSFETLDNVAHVYGLPLEELLSELEKAIGAGE